MYTVHALCLRPYVAGQSAGRFKVRAFGAVGSFRSNSIKAGGGETSTILLSEGGEGAIKYASEYVFVW